MDRLALLSRYVDVDRGCGLEVGALANPVVPPELGKVYFADHLSTGELHALFAADPVVDADKIVAVDFVWGQLTLAEAARGVAPFDYVVAAHVLEHVPDLIGWLGEAVAVLRPGGHLFLVLPDRRVCFDVRRRPSDLSELVEAYLLQLRRPSVAASFDHFSRRVDVDTHARWRGDLGYSPSEPINLEHGWEAATLAARTDNYLDTHCWVFSDREFVDLIGDLARLDLVEFRFVGFVPTQVDELEFAVMLERLDDELDRDLKKATILNSLPEPDPAITFPLPPPVDLLNVSADTLSEREIALLGFKRAALLRARTTLGRLRPFRSTPRRR